MGWFEASILFITGIITFAILLPVGTALMPGMEDTMGSAVTTMISAMFVIILVAAIILYVRQSQEPDQFMGTGMGGFQ